VKQPDNEAVAAPKLSVVTVEQPFGLGNRLGVVGADQRFKSDKMPVASDGIGAVFCHPESPLTDVTTPIADLDFAAKNN
jgi:hypothetical protein